MSTLVQYVMSSYSEVYGTAVPVHISSRCSSLGLWNCSRHRASCDRITGSVNTDTLQTHTHMHSHLLGHTNVSTWLNCCLHLISTVYDATSYISILPNIIQKILTICNNSNIKCPTIDILWSENLHVCKKQIHHYNSKPSLLDKMWVHNP